MSALFDLIVIGGGVNGAGIARDAAGRGARVLLLEARDLANGTSSASTKLVHGGLRYLEYREFALVREALHERETLWRIAPHIVRPMRFVLPHAPGLRPRWMLRAGLLLYDLLAGRSAWPRARALVNAGGPGADDVAWLAGIDPPFSLRRVRGSHIVVPRLFDHPYAYIFQQPDTRIVFAIPYERDFTLIGTTDRDHTGSLADVHADAGEVAYLCAAASRYFRQAIAPGDVVWSYSGVRALVDDGSGRPEAATRGYRLPLSPPGEGAPLLDVYGGKITSYRHLSESAADLLATRLPELAGGAWTAHAPLPGGDFPAGTLDALSGSLQAEYGFLDQTQATRIARAYGTRAGRWLGQARSRGDLGRDFGAGLSEAEVAYLRDTEWARTADDVLWRRSKLGLHMTPAERQGVAAYLGE